MRNNKPSNISNKVEIDNIKEYVDYLQKSMEIMLEYIDFIRAPYSIAYGDWLEIRDDEVKLQAEKRNMNIDEIIK